MTIPIKLSFGPSWWEQRARASWFMQGREERRFRMRVVLSLATELHAIRQIDTFATLTIVWNAASRE